jgi:hypothetical protein
VQDRKNAVAKVSKVPPFRPTKTKVKNATFPMVVVTVRLPAATRDRIKLLFRNNPEFNSISHVIQRAVEEFVDREFSGG